MPDALVIGPLAFAWPVLLAFAASALGLAIATALARRRGVTADADLWWTVLVGFAAARAGFVWEFRLAYAQAPWTVLDLRDGGWSPAWGFAAAALFALARGRALPALARPLGWGFASGAAAWLAGAVWLAVQAPTGQRLPALELAAIGGPPQRLDAYVGRPVVVNLWATWCPPCVREMPLLADFQRARPDVHVVFINQGEPADAVQRWLAQRGLVLRNALTDPHGRAAAAFERSALPTTLFFDREGRLVSRRIGEVSSATLEQQVARAQAADPP